MVLRVVSLHHHRIEALTPREAASEVWEKIKRSEGPIFTVYGRDGSVTDVDLSEDDYNA